MAILKAARRPARWVALLLAFAGIVAGAQSLSTESKLKAVYLVKFTQFVEWPAHALAPNQNLVIGVIGSDPFGRWLDEAVEGETVNHHPLTVRRVNDLKEASGCQVLFIGSSERSRLRSILADLKGHSVLTVSDLQNFCDEGGIVRFVTENNKLRFVINVAATHEANIFISSRLLQLAEIVNGPQNP